MSDTVVLDGDMSLTTPIDGQGQAVLKVREAEPTKVVVDHLEHGWQTPYTSALSFNDLNNLLESGTVVFFLDTWGGSIHYFAPYELSTEYGQEYVYLTDMRDKTLECIVQDLTAPLVFVEG